MAAVTQGTSISVTDRVGMEIYYDRTSRSWWAYYADRQGNQIGSAWFGYTRDEVLLHRPKTPEV